MDQLLLFLALLILGYVFGRVAETRHLKSIRERERDLRGVMIFSSRFCPPGRVPEQTQLVSGSVVISIDYFKRFLAALRNLFGGPVTAYESLLERARREAILRMKAEASASGADMIINVKTTTAPISQGIYSTIGCVEVLAYGTALIR
ncbi:MAG TPA: hypothetical protein DEP79_01740 [Gammaproteobacteria bacterium]|nr:hypothetical protein [Gammaproteobacteria bacterium]